MCCCRRCCSGRKGIKLPDACISLLQPRLWGQICLCSMACCHLPGPVYRHASLSAAGKLPALGCARPAAVAAPPGTGLPLRHGMLSAGCTCVKTCFSASCREASSSLMRVSRCCSRACRDRPASVQQVSACQFTKSPDMVCMRCCSLCACSSASCREASSSLMRASRCCSRASRDRPASAVWHALSWLHMCKDMLLRQLQGSFQLPDACVSLLYPRLQGQTCLCGTPCRQLVRRDWLTRDAH